MKILVSIAIVFSVMHLYAQEFKTEVGSMSKKKIYIYLDRSDLDIRATGSSELVIKTNEKFEVPERAKGLKPLHNNAEDNTGIGLEVKKTEGGVFIKQASGKSANYVFEIPNNFDLSIELGFQSGGINLNGFKGEVEIESKISDVKIENISGPITVNSLSGVIEVIYSSDAIKGPSTLNTVSGDVDVTIPKTAKLDLELSTVTGEVYVADPAKFRNNDKKDEGLYHIGGQNMETKYNGGGENLNMVTVSGNIYFREK